MDFCCNGRFPLLHPAKAAALVVMSAAMLACTPPPARSQVTQEDQMQGTPSPQDVRAEQDRVAAMVDDIAKDAAAGIEGAASASNPPVLPAGLAITSEALTAGIVRLVHALAGPAQTEADFVGQTLGVTLAPDGTGKGQGAHGSLEGGRYEVAVWPLYRNNPGRHVSIQVEPARASQCALAFDALSQALTAAGYVAKPLPRSLGPSVGFSKDVGAIKAFVRLDADRHDAPRCVWQVSIDLEQADG